MDYINTYILNNKLSGKVTKPFTFKTVYISSFIMAIAGMGDALLYIHLPVNGPSLGISAFFIGILLSINKFIRFFSNRWVAKCASNWGVKSVFLSGVILAACSTFVYAFNPVLFIWVIARVCWGIAYSAVRFATIQFAGDSQKPGTAMGLSNSILEAGPVIAYLLGPVLLIALGPKGTFLILSALSVLCLPMFFKLPELKKLPQNFTKWKVGTPHIPAIWIALVAFVVEGMLVVGISRIVDLRNTMGNNLLITTGVYIAARRLFSFCIAPLSGWLSDRWGFLKTFHLGAGFVIGGLILISSGVSDIGILMAFLGGAVNNTLFPLFAIYFSGPDKNFDTLTQLSTFKDMGSAFGALLGMYLLTNVSIQFIFTTTAILLVVLWFNLNKFVSNYERGN